MSVALQIRSLSPSASCECGATDQIALSPSASCECGATDQTAIRLVHTNAMFKDMFILKVSEFVKYKTAIVMFNLFHGMFNAVAKEANKIFECTFYTSKKVICDGSSILT